MWSYHHEKSSYLFSVIIYICEVCKIKILLTVKPDIILVMPKVFKVSDNTVETKIIF